MIHVPPLPDLVDHSEWARISVTTMTQVETASGASVPLSQRCMPACRRECRVSRACVLRGSDRSGQTFATTLAGWAWSNTPRIIGVASWCCSQKPQQELAAKGPAT